MPQAPILVHFKYFEFFAFDSCFVCIFALKRVYLGPTGHEVGPVAAGHFFWVPQAPTAHEVGPVAAGHSCDVVWVPQAHKRLSTAVTSLISTNEHQFRVSTILGPLWAPLPTFTDPPDPYTCPFVLYHQKRRIFITVSLPFGISSF